MIAMKFDKHPGSSAADVPVKFQSDGIIQTANLLASRLHKILWWDVLLDIETRPRMQPCQANMLNGKFIIKGQLVEP